MWSIFAVLPVTGPAASPAPRKEAPIYVIPIADVIDDALLYMVRRGIREAHEHDAAAIVFDMDTPGGRVDTAEDILSLLRELKIPTYAYVNPNAISAGAIIAMATDHIYMAPNSKIGDAMPIMISMFGEIEKMPESIEEKQVSYVAAMIRAAAQHKGHDPELAEAMVRRDSEYKIGEEVISKKGRLLTLTNVEAARPVGDGKKPLLSEGTVEDLDTLLDRIGGPDCDVVEIEPKAAESIATYIESISVILLGLGLLGLYIEFKTPGFGLPGILGILLLAIWFWGSNIAGLAGKEEVAIFIVGLALILLEIFVFPGFGLAGVAGIVLMCVAILMGMVEHYPGGPAIPPLPEFKIPVLRLSGAILLSTIGLLIAARFLPRTTLFDSLVLQSATHRDAGFLASEDTAHMTGRTGIAVSQLRPAGVAQFGDQRLNVVTRGDFIEPGARIVVAEAHGNRIIVERIAAS